MRDSGQLGARLAVLFALGAALFGFPLLAAFNGAGFVAGVPGLYAYLFGAWAALIALIAAVMRAGD